jgi:NADH-quinone oxidoreductase subunit N
MSLLAFQAVNPDVSLTLIAPELIVGVAGVIVMLVDAFSRHQQRRTTAVLSLLALLGAGAASLWLSFSQTAAQSAFNGMVVLDTLRQSFTLIFLLVSFLTILISMVWIDVEKQPAGEFHSLLLFATCGMMLMASAGNLVTIFLGLEILSIATYVMAGFRRTDVRSNEASLKYFILGSFASAFLLYGIALIYGGTATENLPGTTNISLIAGRLNQSLYPPLLLAGVAMLIVGFGFKIATAPFHVWTPDVYEGAPTPVTAFMAAGPKAAGFASFMRVLLFGFPIATAAAATTGGYAHKSWLGALAIMAALTMTIGNVVAIVQNNVKRMLAYSSIAHAGYALVGFVAAP